MACFVDDGTLSLAKNAAVIAAARQSVQAEQEASEQSSRLKMLQCGLLAAAALLGLASLLTHRRLSAALRIAAFPSALAAALVVSPQESPILFAGALLMLLAFAFAAVTFRTKNA